MTRTLQLTVGPDGRVTIPGATPGQTVTIEMSEASDKPERLTLANARTIEERRAVTAEIKRLAQEIRNELSDEDVQAMLNHGDLLYDEDGLPK